MKKLYNSPITFWQILVLTEIFMTGCSSPGGNVALGTVGGGALGSLGGILKDGKVDPVAALTGAASGAGGAWVANKGAEQRVGEAFVTGTEIGNQEKAKETYEVIQRVHKAQEDQGAEKFQTKLYPIEAPLPKNSNVKQVPHDIVVNLQEPAS